MQITFLAPHVKVAGGVKTIIGFSHRLAQRGHDVTIVSPQPLLGKGRVVGLPVIYPKRYFMAWFNYRPKWKETAARFKYVPSLENRYIPEGDIVVATAWPTAEYAKDYTPDKGRKFYYILHYETLFHAKGREDRAEQTYTYPFTKLVISSWVQKIMKEQFNSDSIRITPPIELDDFYPENRVERKKKRVCMLHHKFDWKGVDDGIAAMNIVKDQFKDVEFVIFGAHVRSPKVPLCDEYHYKIYGDRLRALHNSCDIYLCTSWKEGLGKAPMEAMACGVALVTTDTGGNWEYAIDGETALVSPPGNPEALARNVLRLLNDEPLLKIIAENGLRKVRSFNWDDAVDRMERSFLDQLIT